MDSFGTNATTRQLIIHHHGAGGRMVADVYSNKNSNSISI
jgi:hypothetical protein